jgi:hypothetical protein
MATTVYTLCALTSLACAGLLRRGYRRSGARLLYWSALCFGFMALGNAFLIVDVRVVPDVDLSLYRGLPHLAGVFCLLYGLAWETK